MRDEPVVWKSGLTRFSRNPDSLISNLNRAYDNAVVLRESIGSEALSYIQMSVYDMENVAKSEVPLLELQQVLDNILGDYRVKTQNLSLKFAVVNVYNTGE